jgi:hypothetical protein
MKGKHVKLADGAPASSERDLTVLSRTVSRLDAATLDRIWLAALRGDMDLVEQVLADHKVSGQDSVTPQWSETNSWAFGRVSKKR